MSKKRPHRSTYIYNLLYEYLYSYNVRTFDPYMILPIGPELNTSMRFPGAFPDSRWRHQMETFSSLLALCAGYSPVTGEFPSQRPVTQSFDVSFDLCLTKRLSKQSWGWRFEMLWRSLRRHCNVSQVCYLAALWEILRVFINSTTQNTTLHGCIISVCSCLSHYIWRIMRIFCAFLWFVNHVYPKELIV